MKSSPAIEAEFAAIRARVAFIEQDRLLAPDIESMRRWARQDRGPGGVRDLLPSHRADAH